MKKSLSFSSALFLKSLKTSGAVVAGFIFICGEALGMNNKTERDKKIENAMVNIFQNKEMKLTALTEFGNPCEEGKFGLYKGFSLISGSLKLFGMMALDESITNTIIDNYVKLFRYTMSGYSKDLKVCFGKIVPGFQSYPEGAGVRAASTRTGAEAFVDNLEWVARYPWKHRKINRDGLRHVFELGADLQKRGMIDPSIEDGFINNAMPSVRSIYLSEMYPEDAPTED